MKSVSICAALILAVAVFADSAEARPGGVGGARMGGARFAGPGRMGIAGPGRFAGPMRVGPGRLLGQVEVIGPATGGLVIGAAGIGAVDVSGPGGAWALASHSAARLVASGCQIMAG